MKNRWIALYVENQVGVLAKVSGLFSGKSYNLQSLTVGPTEDATVSRMTICVTSDDITFEQIKKQLNRMVEVIKVIDLTNVPIHMKEILFAKVKDIRSSQIDEVFRIAEVFSVQVADIGKEIDRLRGLMNAASRNLDFEAAISYRDKIAELKEIQRSVSKNKRKNS